jgi:transcriptional regulator with XRE-family HTH domain
MDTMGKRIEFFRKKRGLTQKDLADKLNLKNGGTVSAWEVDTTSPKPAMMLELCKVLDISISELFGVEENKGLTKEEEKLLASYKDLNEEGQERLAEYTGFLGFKYKKD